MIRNAILALTSVFMTGVYATEQTTPIPFINSSATIDGQLNEPVWQQAKKISINNITWPQENIPSPVSTTAYVYENGQSLFVAFKADDSEPDLIRAFFRDRDRAWNDDLVGIKIDSFNRGRSAYQFFINPLGVQQDSIENELTKSENSSWNGIWDSAGVIHKRGYTVEVEIPLRVLNFDDSQQLKNMAMEFVRFLPRDQRLRLSNMQISHANNCWICQMPTFTGFEKAKQGNNIAIIPSMVLSKSQSRDIDGSDVPDWQDEDKSEPSLDLKWAITPDTTLNATLNPDFSQVEADTGQLSVNNSFSLFFPEKRAFFLDNEDYFSSHLNLIHTRNIAAPDFGVKLSGNKVGHTYGVFITNDEHLNVMVPGNLGSSVVSLEQKSNNAALRYRYDINDGLSVGTSATLRDSQDYKSQLVSIDTKYKPTTSDTFKVQILRSNTQYSNIFAEELCDGDEGDCVHPPTEECMQGQDCDFNESVLRVLQQDNLNGLGYFLNYEHNTKHWRAFTSYQNYDRELRADMGFMSQVDFNKFLTGFEYRWYGEQNNWWNRARWYSDWDITHNDNGTLIEKEVQTNIAIDGPLQSFIDVGVEHRKRRGLRHNKASLKIQNNSHLFSENTLWTYLEFKPVSGLFASLNLRTGNKVDLANNRVGNMHFARPAINLNLGKHFEINVRHSYETLNADGAKVYTANLSDIRLTYQFNINSYLRIAVIHTDINRNTQNYIDEVDARYEGLSTQLLYSYKLNPQTVFFAGFTDNGYQDDDLSKLTKDEKTFFAKFSYAWLM
ncbi:hypothetical protein PSECIP111854_00670 [Pseudoalteromonas sp. CIP111854]|uniref:Hydrolase n=2 Tax=Pseudoalteromonas holothuriae TaxID=2963714 RepID=A0A9W4QSD7_9GAMM|nr:hypothetical protein PSECIP111854_00670 [Pseudoalteromonas sp. CIP111854]